MRIRTAFWVLTLFVSSVAGAADPFLGGPPQRGPSTAKVSIVVFTELGCPFCARVQPTLIDVQKKYGADVRLVWHGFIVHERARPAHLAAAAAAMQGKFWEFHDRYFAWHATHNEFPDAAFVRKMAADAGVDLRAYDEAIASGKAAAQVEADQQLGTSLGVRGTPTFFVNGRKLMGAQSLDAFVKVIDEEKRKAGPARTVGPDPAKTYAVPIAGSPTRGPADAKVTIVEFAEFKCPYCARSQATLAALEKKYGKNLRIVWKHMLIYPLTSRPIARAAIAVAAQGRFWPFAARVWASWATIDEAGARKLAEAVGCDMKEFDQAVAARFGDGTIEEDIRLAKQLGVDSTPTFFINGRVLTGAQPQANFEALIEVEMKKIDRWRAGGGKGLPYDHILEIGEKGVETSSLAQP